MIDWGRMAGSALFVLVLGVAGWMWWRRGRH